MFKCLKSTCGENPQFKINCSEKIYSLITGDQAKKLFFCKIPQKSLKIQSDFHYLALSLPNKVSLLHNVYTLSHSER